MKTGKIHKNVYSKLEINNNVSIFIEIEECPAPLCFSKYERQILNIPELNENDTITIDPRKIITEIQFITGISNLARRFECCRLESENKDKNKDSYNNFYNAYFNKILISKNGTLIQLFVNKKELKEIAKIKGIKRIFDTHCLYIDCLDLDYPSLLNLDNINNRNYPISKQNELMGINTQQED